MATELEESFSEQHTAATIAKATDVADFAMFRRMATAGSAPGADAGAGGSRRPVSDSPPRAGSPRGGSDFAGSPRGRSELVAQLSDGRGELFDFLARSSKCDGHTICAMCLKKFPDTALLEGRHEVKMLPCFHSVCGPCLEAMLASHAADNNFVCPLCRRRTAKKPLHEFLPHFAVLSSIDSEKIAQSKFNCEECISGNQAKAYCSDCCMNLCGACAKQHRRAKATARHELSSLIQQETTGTSGVVHRAQYCAVHRRSRYEFYCQDCDMVICRECALSIHQNHSYKLPFEALVQQHRSGLQEMLSKLYGKLLDAQELHRQLNQKCEGTAASTQRARAELEEAFDTLQQATERRCSELTWSLMSRGSDIRGDLEAEKSACCTALADIWRTIDFLQKVISRGTDVEVLLVKCKLFKEQDQLRQFRQWQQLAHAELPAREPRCDIAAGWRSQQEHDSLFRILESFGGLVVQRPAEALASPAGVAVQD